MSEFQLDTSGVVYKPGFEYVDSCGIYWTDLSPFVQGYVEAMLSPCEALHFSLTDRFAAFSDLASETLAQIIEDCAEAVRKIRGHHPGMASDGEAFWTNRQNGWFASFPPLTLSLNDDGKAVFG